MNKTISKSPTILKENSREKISFFKRTQIIKAINSPQNIHLLSFKENTEFMDENIDFQKETLMKNFFWSSWQKIVHLQTFAF